MALWNHRSLLSHCRRWMLLISLFRIHYEYLIYYCRDYATSNKHSFVMNVKESTTCIWSFILGFNTEHTNPIANSNNELTYSMRSKFERDFGLEGSGTIYYCNKIRRVMKAVCFCAAQNLIDNQSYLLHMYCLRCISCIYLPWWYLRQFLSSG